MAVKVALAFHQSSTHAIPFNSKEKAFSLLKDQNKCLRGVLPLAKKDRGKVYAIACLSQNISTIQKGNSQDEQ